MKGFLSVLKKELYLMFASPVFYVVAFIFLALAGYFFYSSLLYYTALSFQATRNPLIADQLSLTDMLIRPLFVDLSVVLLLVAPLLSMRAYAEERRAGTMELLLTYPLSDRGTLAAKFIALLIVYLLLLVGTLPALVFLNSLSKLNWDVILCGYLGLFLLGTAFLSFGMFASSLTRSQIISATVAFGVLLMFWVIGWAGAYLSPEAGRAVRYLSIIEHFESFTKGVLDVRDMVYYLAFIFLFQFLTLRRVESYRWCG